MDFNIILILSEAIINIVICDKKKDWFEHKQLDSKKLLICKYFCIKFKLASILKVFAFIEIF